MTRRRLVAPVQHLRIEVDVARPLDRSALRVHADLFEDVASLVDRREHAAGRKQLAQVDVLNRTIAECDADPVTVSRLYISDIDDVAHRSGSICSGCS